jgi:hypothetical protein
VLGRLIFVAIVLHASPAAAEWREHFLGWTYDSSAYGVERRNSQMHEGWFACPKKLAPNTDCDHVDGEGLDKFADVPRVLPKGTTVALTIKRVASSDDKRVDATVTVRAGGKTVSDTLHLDDAYDIEIDDNVSPDAKMIVVSVSFKKRGDTDDGGGPLQSISILALDVSALKLRPNVDRKAALTANVEGMAAIKRRDWRAAQTAFERSIAIDDSFVYPHYNLASVTSIIGQASPPLRELRWLAASKDPVAKELLKKALTDPDIDFISVDPVVRKLLGMPVYPTKVADRLVERRGVWSSDGVPCTRATLTISFAAGGKLSVTAVDECKGKREEKTTRGTWKDDGSITLDPPIANLPAKSAIDWITLCGETETAARQIDDGCFRLGATKRAFHRGGS